MRCNPLSTVRRPRRPAAARHLRDPHPEIPNLTSRRPVMTEPSSEIIAQATHIEEIETGIVEALKTVFDPEIPVNIYEMGLIYDLNIEASGAVKVKMTLTSPACPVAG